MDRGAWWAPFHKVASMHTHACARLHNWHIDTQLISGCFKSLRTSIAHSVLTCDLWWSAWPGPLLCPSNLTGLLSSPQTRHPRAFALVPSAWMLFSLTLFGWYSGITLITHISTESYLPNLPHTFYYTNLLCSLHNTYQYMKLLFFVHLFIYCHPTRLQVPWRQGPISHFPLYPQSLQNLGCSVNLAGQMNVAELGFKCRSTQTLKPKELPIIPQCAHALRIIFTNYSSMEKFFELAFEI